MVVCWAAGLGRVCAAHCWRVEPRKLVCFACGFAAIYNYVVALAYLSYLAFLKRKIATKGEQTQRVSAGTAKLFSYVTARRLS